MTEEERSPGRDRRTPSCHRQPDERLAGAALDGVGPARQRLANLVVRGPGNLTTQEQYAALVDEARREKEQAERALAEQSAAFRAEQARAEVRPRGGSDPRFPSDSALVSFVRFNRTTVPVPGPVPSYLAFILKTGSADPEVVFLGRAGSDRAADCAVAQRDDGRIGRPAASASETERAFRVTGTTSKELWDPIATHLRVSAGSSSSRTMR